MQAWRKTPEDAQSFILRT